MSRSCPSGRWSARNSSYSAAIAGRSHHSPTRVGGRAGAEVGAAEELGVRRQPGPVERRQRLVVRRAGRDPHARARRCRSPAGSAATAARAACRARPRAPRTPRPASRRRPTPAAATRSARRPRGAPPAPGRESAVAGLAAVLRRLEHAPLLQPRHRRPGRGGVDVEVLHQRDQRAHGQPVAPRRARRARTATGSGAAGSASGIGASADADAAPAAGTAAACRSRSSAARSRTRSRAGTCTARSRPSRSPGARPPSPTPALTTYALTSIPRASSGTPTTAHSATSGCLSSASSTSGAAML